MLFKIINFLEPIHDIFFDTRISFIGGRWGWAQGPLPAPLAGWRCFLSPAASSRLAAQVGWRRVRCAGPRKLHLLGRPALQWLRPRRRRLTGEATLSQCLAIIQKLVILRREAGRVLGEAPGGVSPKDFPGQQVP